MNAQSKPIVTRGRLAAAAILACGAFLGIGASSASAANPSILNTGTGCSGQTQWLVSCAAAGETNNNGNFLRASGWVSHDTGNTLASIITDDDWDGTSDPSNVRGVTGQRPNIAGGYPRSRFNLSYQFSTSNTGMSCGFLSGTRRTTDRNARIQARDSASQTSGTTSSIIKFTAAGQCTGVEDYAYLYAWGANNFNNSVTPGSNVTFTYTGDDPDTTGSSDFQGIGYRLRNLRTGATSGVTVSCPGNGDNATKSVTVNFPDRGAFVVEAELRDGGGCTDNQNAGFWFPIGTADVNSSAAPSLSLDSATTTQGGVVRPTYGQNFTVRAQGLVDPDSGDGGGAQIVEWDLDNNTGNGVSGFETTNVAGYGSTLTAPVSQTVNSGAQTTPGLYSVRGKVTDNGAGDAADNIRRTSGAVTLQYRVNAAPTASSQTVTTDTNASNVPVTLSGSDPDGDTLTWTHGNASHGTIGGSGANLTYTPTAGYAGTDSFTITADDGFGRTSTATVSINVRPDTTITSNPSSLSTDRNPSFQFTSNGSPVTFECQLDGGGFSACTSPQSYTNLADGQHTFQVRAIATTGSVADPTPASYTWTIDGTPPDTVFDSTPPALTNSTSANFTFHSTEGNSTFECNLDNAGFTACSSPKSYTVLNGNHTLQVRAIDQAGNPDPTPASYSWTVNTVAPNTTINSGPNSLTNQTSATFTFQADEANSSFQCKLDGGNFTNCSSPQTYNNLGDGQHTFQVQATDQAGNTGPAASYTWTVDTQGPTTTIDTFPPNPTNSSTANFTFQAMEAGSTFQCQIDGGGYSSCTSPKQYTGLGDGSHTFDVKATDPAGNTGSAQSYTWVIDTTPPDTVIDTRPNSLSNSTNASFTFHSTEPTGATFQCKLDSGPFQNCTSPQAYSGLSQGQHTFQVQATDAAGNTDPSADSFTWNVDTIAPATSIDTGSQQYPPPGVNNSKHRTTSTTADFDFFSNDPTATFECRLDSSNEADFQPCTAPKQYTGLADGPHKFEVRAVDPTGNRDQTPDSWSWEVYSGLPNTIIDTFPANPSNSTSAQFTFHSSIPDSTFRCSLDGAPLSSCTSPQNYTNLSQGQHTFQVVATDEFGRDDPSPATYTWSVDTTAPDTVIDSKPLNPSNSSSASFTFHSTEQGSLLQCQLDGGGWTQCDESQPQVYTNLSDGQHTFQVRATDPAGNVDQTPASYTWTVDTQAPDTTITQKPDDPSRINNPSFQFTSSEPTGATFECRLDSTNPLDFQPCTTNKQYTNLTEGQHTFEVRAIDAAGNVDQTPATYTWTVDQTPPDTTITSQPANPTNSTSATFQFSSEPNATFECRIDSNQESDFQACTSGKTYSNLSEGSHTFDVRAIDQAGNKDTSPASYTWSIDTTAPETTINTAPSNPTNSSSATFTFTADDNNATFQCDIDGGGYQSCTSPQAYLGLSEGQHTFSVRATDSVGNVESTPATYTWTIDQSAPDTTIDTGPSDPSNDTAPTFTFSSNEASSSFQCNLDNTAFAACSSPKQYSNLGEGPHTLQVVATDQAGNSDQSPATFTWTVDLTGPQMTLDSSPSNPTNQTSANFTFHANENTSAVVCSLDNAPFTACDSSGAQAYSNLSDAQHTFQVKGTDIAGNPGQATSYTWTVNTAAPTTTIDTKPSNPSNNASPDFTFRSETGASLECQIDGGGYSACNTSTSQHYNTLGDGQHTFDVRAKDQAGNTGQPASYTWTIDTQPPTATIDTNPPANTNQTSGTFTFHSEQGATLECQIDGGGYSSCTSPKTYNSLSDGQHTFDVQATDQAGNTGQPASYTWNVDTQAPTVDITSGPADPTNQTSASFTFSTGGNPNAVQCDLDGGGFSACDTSSSQSYTGLAQGQHTLTVKVLDAAGNSSTDTYAWTIDTTPPDTVIDTKPSDPTKQTAADFTFHGTESGSGLACKLDAGAFAPCDSATGQHYGSLADGQHTFTVKATDPAGNEDPSPASYTWTVNTVAPGVSITSAPSGITNQTSADVSFTTSGNPATVNCQLDAGSFVACTSPQHYSNLADGQHTVTVRATDAANNQSTDARTWTVNTGPPNTTITSRPADGTTDNFATFSFASNEDPSTFECQLDGGGFQTCAPPKTYGGLAVGAHTFQVRATDAANNTDATPDTYTWTIASPPTPEQPQSGVAGKNALSPLIKRRVRALNVPVKGVFQIATVTCRTGSCRLDQQQVIIKVGGKTYIAPLQISTVAKTLAASDTTIPAAHTADIVVIFSKAVQQALMSNNYGHLTVQLSATSDGAGGASDSKTIKLKAKWLKQHLK